MKRKKNGQIKPGILLGILVLFAMLSIGISYKSNGEGNAVGHFITFFIAPMEKGINSIGIKAASKSELKNNIEVLESENEALQLQVNQQASTIQAMENNLSELDALRSLLELKEKYPSYSMVGARIISKDAGNWYHTFLIDKGSSDGIKKDMNVIADNGLVGIVTDVGSNHSRVRAIIDDNSSVSAMATNTSDLCIIRGDLELLDSGKIDVEMVSIGSKLKEGDEVLTSYISDKYLPGFVIGYITEVERDNKNQVTSAKLTPKVNFSNLTNVLVITQLKEDIQIEETVDESKEE